LKKGIRRDKFDMQLNYIQAYTFITKYCFQNMYMCLWEYVRYV